MKSNLDILYNELLQREKALGEKPATLSNNARMAELKLVIIMVQQLLLKKLNK